MRDEDFLKTINQGTKYEQLTINHYLKRGFNISEFQPNIKKSEYDFKVIKGDKEQYIEVKSDNYAIKTGNIAIEYKSNNIDSGISITKAKYYIYYVINGNNYDVYKIPVVRIKKMINNNEFFKDIKCGYKYLSQCYLFKLSLFSKYKIFLKI